MFRRPITRFSRTLSFALVCTVPALSEAATIVGSLSSPTVYSNVDISTDVTDWAYFGIGGDASAVEHKADGPVSFSAITGGSFVGGDSRMFLGFTGGSSTGTLTGGTSFVSAQQSDGASLSFTYTVLGVDQSLQIYLVGYNSRADINVSLASGGSYSLEDQVLPYTDDGDATGSGHHAGLLTLDLTGATVGDVLTFTVSNEYDGVSDPSFGLIGIQAVTVVPEPSAAALLGGCGMLVLLRRRRPILRNLASV
ncbi:PEP-CTERM sorting domain-containing protein [Luteolibacter luteus]|uniref:PEP-CTERM sorting domain-containing protein n=1 Tax=Luteolibacter luteus TaxID=2728835 RepID=A0A858RPT7_9BACT|nr:PEP-CTERM sorting domain-containing protein [Luteolibacter luteus]QJE99047.1 PEP-CTERM sorting domain-containing protein [Luteolibacter luteus]